MSPPKNTLFKRAEKAGEVAQALFYTFIQNTWAYDMSNIRIIRYKAGHIAMIEIIAGPGTKEGPGGASTCERYAGGWLIKFPAVVFNSEDEVAKRAVLADQNSIWAFVCMHVALQALFEGILT